VNNNTGLFEGLALAMVLAVVGSLLLLVTKTQRADLKLQIILFLVAFAVRFAASIVIYQFGFNEVLGEGDASGWGWGVKMMRDWMDQGVGLLELPFVLAGSFGEHHKGYGYMLGAFFFITDCPARLPAAALNGFFGAAMVVFAFRIARTLFSDWVANRVGWWTALFPSMVIWSAMTVKEPVIILLETVALYGCVQLRKQGPSIRYLGLCAATIVLLLPFRFYATVIVAGAVLLSLFLPGLARLKTGLTALCLSAILVPGILVAGTLAKHEAQFAQFDMDKVESFRHSVATGHSSRSGVVTDYDMKTPVGFGLATGIGFAHLMLAPFPWQLGGASTRMMLTLPELLFWWWLFFAGVAPGVVYCLRNRLPDVAAMLLLICGFGLLYSMLFGNVGLIFRQRAQLLPWLFIFAAVGLEQRHMRSLAMHQVRRLRLTYQPYVRAQRA
jgi:hypothetical protein